jgi:gliding motility-associated lipoprotein GldD
MIKYTALYFGLIINILIGCSNEEEQTYLPKPYGYQRIDLAPANYHPVEMDLPYSLLISDQAKVKEDSSFMTEDYWIEVYYPDHRAQINVSYKPLRGNRDSLAHYVNTSIRLTNKHQIRAHAIRESIVRTKKGHQGVISKLEGDVPSAYQWFVTDSVNHFVRAALYFPTSTENDSLLPVINHIRKDMDVMLNSVDWK